MRFSLTFVSLFLACSSCLLSTNNESVSLALSGGGARGFAQIGVLEVLEEEGIHISGIAGTSIGAIVGGLYAAGYTPKELDSIMSAQNWSALLSINDGLRRTDQYLNQKFEEDRSLITLHFNKFDFVVPESAASGYRISELLNELVWRAPFHAYGNFDSLGIPFRAVATDLIKGDLVVLKSGNLASAMRASSTIPLQFAPLERDSMILIDGGLLANVPEIAARELYSDIVVGVNTTSPLHTANELNTPWNVADQAISILMKRFSDESLKKCDVLVTPNLAQYTSTDFDRIPEIIEEGRKAARQALPALKRKLSLGAAATQYLTVKNIRVQCQDAELSQKLEQIARDVEGLRLPPHRLRTLSAKLSRAAVTSNNSLGKLYTHLHADGTLVVTYSKVYIHSIEIVDSVHIQRPLIERELKFTTGATFNIDDAMLSWRNLIASDLFSDASIKIAQLDNNSDSIVVQVRLKQGGTQRISMGMRIDNERNTQFSLDLIENSIAGTGLRFSVYLAGGLSNQKVSANLSVPRILDTYWTFGLRGFLERENIGVFRTTLQDKRYFVDEIEERRQEQYGTRFYAGRQLGRAGVVLGSLRYSKQRAYDVVRPKTDYQDLATIAGQVVIDTRDFGDFSSSGDEFEFNIESSLLSINDNATFSKAALSYNKYVSYGAHTFVGKVSMGVADLTTPELEQFYLGGENQFWGLREFEHRGTQLLTAGLSWRVKLPVQLFFDTYLQGHYQFGNVWSQPTSITFKRLRQGSAFELLLDTPVGPASISVARSFFFDEQQVLILGPTISYFSVGVPL